MRSSNKRSRSKSNRNRSMGNVVNRVFDSSGPEGKVRGTPQQIIDKYNQLARDAQLSNDRVAAENFQQHAEHYLRMLAEAQREQAERQAQQQQNQQNNQNSNQNNGQQGGGQQNDNRNQQPQGDAQPQQLDQRSGQDGGNTDQRGDDVIDVQGDASSTLVDTPEEKPQRPRRTRRKAPVQDEAPQTDAAE